MLADVVHQPQAQYDLEDEVSLVYVHLPPVHSKNAITSCLDGAQRPEARVAAEVQDTFSGKGASKEMHKRVEEVFLALLMAINPVLLEDRGKIALEIKLVVPSGEAGYLFFDLFAFHSC